MPFLPTASSGASWHHFVKIPAASGGALEGRSLSCWGNLSPKPPNKDAIPPHRKQWGILASFREATVGRAMAINRRMHGAPGPWSSARDEHEPATEPRHLPYRPHYRHHLWFVDIRYLVKLEGHWVYSLCILEGYSRTILAGMASEHQDLHALLQLL